MQLKLENVSKFFEKHGAISRLNLHFDHFQTLALIGPSGGGKSTLLRLLAGLETPDEGSIKVDGKEVPKDENSRLEYRKNVGTVFQAWNLFPHLTAMQNISLPLYRVHGYSKKESEDRALSLLKRFGLEKHAHKKPGELSGGQCQRTAIVRAAAIKPKILLLDEPTSALDPIMTSEVLDLIEELKEEGCNLVLVSHHLGFVKKIADYVAFIAEGKLIECNAASALFNNPQSDDVKHFLDKALKY